MSALGASHGDQPSGCEVSAVPLESSPGDLRSQLVFVGTGVSAAIPSLAHLLEMAGTPCAVCRSALDPLSPNRRNNVSLLIRYAHPGASEPADILIDVGKTFRDAALRVLVPLGVRSVAAILLTHDHADAMGGMDDARDLQPFKEDDDGFQARKLPVYLSRATFNVFRSSFPYIVEASEAVGPIRRRVAQLDFRFLDDDPNAPVQDVEVAGLQIAVLPVYHGGDYVSFGFAFGTTHRVLYLSDVSQVPPPIQAYIDGQVFDVIILDCLHTTGRKHFSHFCIDDAVAFTFRVDPVRAYFVGMFCDVEHVATNAYLATQMQLHRRAGGRLESMQLAHDGLVLPLNL